MLLRRGGRERRAKEEGERRKIGGMEGGGRKGEAQQVQGGMERVDREGWEGKGGRSNMNTVREDSGHEMTKV